MDKTRTNGKYETALWNAWNNSTVFKKICLPNFVYFLVPGAAMAHNRNNFVLDFCILTTTNNTNAYTVCFLSVRARRIW